MEILLIQPPLGDGTVRMPQKQRLFPWGFSTVARFLEDDGHDISVLDIYAEDLIRSEVEDYLDNKKFDAACITGFSSINYLYVIWLAEEIKKRYAVPVVVGGLLADYHYDLLLSKGNIDICVIGEGELTSVDLFRNIDKSSRVKGIAYINNGEIVVNDQREYIDDLDTLPMPNFDLWNMDRYTKVRMYSADESTMYDAYDTGHNILPESLLPNMSFLSERGCPYKCRFCSRSYEYLRLKSVGRIMEEIRYIVDTFQLKSIHFSDELLLVKKERTLEFCKEIKKLNLLWDGQSRVNLMDAETIKAIKDANCLSIGLGIESGSDKMLKAMNKGITRKQSIEVLKRCKDAGLHIKIQLMGGYPGESKETLYETASLLKEVGLPPRRLTWCTPMPGSELYEDVKSKGMIHDEEEYIIKLHKGYNSRDNIVLNVSGNSDSEMIHLFDLVHLKMDINYLFNMLKEPRKIMSPVFFKHFKETISKTMRIYFPFIYNLGFLRAFMRGVFSIFDKISRWSSKRVVSK